MYHKKRLPIGNLLALTLSGFIAIITETIPAGLLPFISKDIGVSEALAGQFISAYALGSVVSAIPIIIITQKWDRKKLLMTAVAGFFIFNLGTFIFRDYYILLLIRFLAGAAGGAIWGMLTGYTIRMVSADKAGKAMAIVGIGQPFALSIGVPLGTWIGQLVGWKYTFLIIAAISMLLFMWIFFKLPHSAGEPGNEKFPLKKIFKTAGVINILATTLFWILGHNILYTFIAPWLGDAGLGDRVDLLLFIFGMSSVAGILVTGIFIDRWMEKLGIAWLMLFLAAINILLFSNGVSNVLVYAGVFLWGFSFGGAPIILQKYLARIANKFVDVAQSVFVTVFNISVAFGGILGGIFLEKFGIKSILYPIIFFTVCALIFLVSLVKRKL